MRTTAGCQASGYSRCGEIYSILSPHSPLRRVIDNPPGRRYNGRMAAPPPAAAPARPAWGGAILAGGGALALYLPTLAPDLTWRAGGADGGDLITAAAQLGIPHPTGYPTYTLLAALFLRLPWAT